MYSPLPLYVSTLQEEAQANHCSTLQTTLQISNPSILATQTSLSLLNPTTVNSNINIIGITNQILPQNPVKGNIPYPGNNMTLYLLDKKTGQMDSYNISRSVTLGTNNSYIIGNVTITNKFKNTSKNYSIMDYNTIIKDCPGRGISKPVFITFY